MLEKVYSYKGNNKKYKHFKEIEKKYDTKLESGLYVIRFDGKGMTKTYNIKNKAVNEEFYKVMQTTFLEFIRKNKIKIAYKFSDEISIVINVNEENNRLEKLLSIFASNLTSLFYKNAVNLKFQLKNLPCFDARIIKMKNKEEVYKYISSRQNFCIFRYLERLRSEYGLDFKLNNSKDIIEKLNEIGGDYDLFNNGYKFGTLIIKNKVIEQEIDIDLIKEITNFKEGMDYDKEK